MDLWQLKIFCNVVESKSFSKAGEIIHLSQPTISSHIKDLESHFNCRLIDRLGKEALPSKAGELLYRLAKDMLSMQDAMEATMAEFHGTIKGKLNIGGSTIPGGYILPKYIGEFVGLHPDVRISLKINDTRQIIESIVDGNFEMGMVGAKIDNPKIIQEAVIEDDMCVVIPKGHKWFKRKSVNIEDLIKEPFIIREPGSGTRKSFEERLNDHKIKLDQFNIIAELGSTSSVIQGIKSSIGVSVLSSIAVEEECSFGILKVIPIKGIDLSRKFYLTINKSRTPSPLMKSFFDFIKNMTN